MATKTAAIKTLGCKLNQFESEQMREQLEALGYCIVPFEAAADLYVINSCTVTTRTASDCRRLCRGTKRLNPESVLLITGCYAQVAPRQLEQIAATDIVIGNAARGRLAQFVPSAGTAPIADLLPPYAETGPMIRTMSGHTRAFVKVQEGCDAHCAYCIIPLARGPSRSVPAGDVIEQANLLVAAGYPEIVLIGTHLGQYGADLEEDTDLRGLVRRLCQLPNLPRLRLSSIEPCEITDELTELVAAGGHCLEADSSRLGWGKLCRHWHIPMQSGCDEILQRMNRPYDTPFYRSVIEKIKSAQPDTAIGADVIVGFPGETDEQFEQTRAFVESLPLTYLHVFTYSARPGTAAARMPDQVPGQVRKDRNHILRVISERKRAAFAEKMVGKQLEVVIEQFTEASGDKLSAITDNYLRAAVAGSPELVGSVAKVQVTEAEGATLHGELVE
ncbi:MAG: tRNA (N(6)-L-threonylcarbamoyladenosine(37)-C(2))-methylthiotransferase MtaB [Armatimonadetes bacterium]|nr:tRNA (N(6)-L-threonylcarbamoyladenosine(37)-C(2))-methylthiotransferase MtaB [Armatimonadota bacterium]